MDTGSVADIIALAAGALALIAVALAVALLVQVRRLRAAQAVVLGGHEHRDLVGHAEHLDQGFFALRSRVEQAMGHVDERVGAVERRLDGTLAHHALVRYDAYGDMSGRQSASFVLLDARRSGIVVSSILHREQARIYVKQIFQGESELELSPEEQEAMELALGASRA